MVARFFRTLGLIWITITTGAAVAAPYAGMYLGGLIVLALAATLSPLPLAIAGVAGGWKWLTATAGLLWLLFSLVTLTIATPLGVLIEKVFMILYGEITPGAGKRYALFVGSILFLEASIAFAVTMVPLRNNLYAIPVLALAAAVLVIANIRWGTGGAMWRTVVVFAAALTVIGILFTMTFPKTSAAVSGRWSDEGVARKIDRIHQEVQRISKPPEVRILSCGDGDEYISSNERVVMVEAGNGCHTKWQNRPEQSTRWDFGVSAVDRTIKGKIAFSDGSEKPFEDNPRLRTTNRGHVTAYRFETQTAPYLVKIIMK